MLALTALCVASALAQTSALHVHSANVKPGLATYDKQGNVMDPGTRVYTKGSEENAHLPDIYGDGPRISGLNQCKDFQQRVNPIDRKWGAAGMPNTGTNALYDLMSKNCVMANQIYQNGGWQVPWGKHNFLNKNTSQHTQSTLAVALAKDPLQWMASTCRKSYFSVTGVHGNGHCPSPVNQTQGHYFENENHFTSLIDVWARWYEEYYANEYATQPALVIRFEDLLFKPEETISKVCECMGFEAKRGDDFMILESISKWGSGHGQPTNRSETINHYTTKRDAILSRLTADDAAYMAQTIANLTANNLMDFFHYPRVWNFKWGPSDISSPYHSLLNNAQISGLLATSDWGDDE